MRFYENYYLQLKKIKDSLFEFHNVPTREEFFKMLTAKINNYSVENIEHLEEIIIRGLMDLPCSHKCDNCPNKVVCTDVIACHRFLCDTAKLRLSYIPQNEEEKKLQRLKSFGLDKREDL